MTECYSNPRTGGLKVRAREVTLLELAFHEIVCQGINALLRVGNDVSSGLVHTICQHSSGKLDLF